MEDRKAKLKERQAFNIKPKVKHKKERRAQVLYFPYS